MKNITGPEWFSIAALIVILSFIVLAATVGQPDKIDSERPLSNEMGVYCTNGTDPVVVGMEEKYLIVRCEAKH